MVSSNIMNTLTNQKQYIHSTGFLDSKIFLIGEHIFLKNRWNSNFKINIYDKKRFTQVFKLYDVIQVKNWFTDILGIATFYRFSRHFHNNFTVSCHIKTIHVLDCMYINNLPFVCKLLQSITKLSKRKMNKNTLEKKTKKIKYFLNFVHKALYDYLKKLKSINYTKTNFN